MKKRSIYFVVLAVFAVLGFSSCSKEKGPADKISKEYTAENLVVTNAGESITNGTVKIAAVSDNEAKITIDNLVNGHPTFEVLARVIQTKSQAEYAFEGQKNVDGMSVSVEGTVVDGVASVDIEVQIVNPTILKSWTYSFDESEKPTTAIFELTNKSGKVSWEDKEITTEDFNSNVGDLLNIGLSIGLSQFTLTFDKNGYVGIEGFSPMAPDGQQEINIPKLARYYYNPTAKLLVFDAPLEGLLPGMGTVQVPFDCVIENNVLKATIKKEFLAELIAMIPTGEALEQLLEALDGVFPPDFADYLPFIKIMVKDILVAITDPDVTSIKLGAQLAELTPLAPAASISAAPFKAKLIKQ